MSSHPAGGLRPCGCGHTQRTHDDTGLCGHPVCGCLRFHLATNTIGVRAKPVSELITDGYQSPNQATRTRAAHLEEYLRDLEDRLTAERRLRQAEAAADAEIAKATQRFRAGRPLA